MPELKWSEVRAAPVVLISGTETVLADRAARLLRDSLRQSDPSVEISDVNAAEYVPGDLASFASPSLFGEPRLIRVSSAEKANDAFIEELLVYLQAPADDTTVVVRHGGGQRGKKFLDGIRSGVGGGVEVVCSELKRDADKYDFAQAEFRMAGKKATPGALRAVTSAFADDLAELASACQQLISDASTEITEATVDRYYGGRVETNAFKVADATLAGRHGEALITLRHALASGADPVPMVAAFASKLRTMAKLWGARGSSAQLASQFGLAPWQVDRARRDLQGWTDEGLARGIEAIALADAEVKGGGRDPEFALERMIDVLSSRGEAVRP
ncbi:DNA polymerase III subunit delta [Humibacter ginsenosidimutans]|uniref:DNA-directed DNA polymerase n=1 Tax=Humibacter ginsenosidimutans TaxID=2599293 RepID=A0A5B8MAD2_9MICO|nr:DNA polymerase III subunit delta [Humibacter ginsenosidimutans]QDZ16665.1 DNA polymerase III subunit delta [Humibacter ginsenosidimutans]